MNRRQIYDLLSTFLRPLLAFFVTISIYGWQIGFSTYGRRVLGITLMTYALLSIWESSLEYHLDLDDGGE